MSPETKTVIEKTIKQLNYVPNSIAQSLKTNKTKKIGVVVRDIAGAYTGRAIRGMDDYCKQTGYDLLIYNSDFDAKSEAKAIESLKQLHVDGLIIASSGQNTDLLAATFSDQTPIVQFQLERDNQSKNIVVSDYVSAAYQATQHLLKLGHRRICFVTQNYQDVKSRAERFQGYQEALAAQNIATDPSLILNWHRENGFARSPRKLLTENKPPTAFFTQHLAITTELLEELDTGAINIPDDVSVLGFDELPMAEFFKTPITVIKQQPYTIGVEAAKVVIQRINTPDQPNERILVPCSLIERESCSPPKIDKDA